MQGTLDLSAHRLDAWVTSVATKRLAAMHVDGPTGQYVGAYGWVENLKPIPASFVKPVTTLPRRRAGTAADAGQRQRLHPRAVDDARRDRGAAAQRAPRPDRRAEPDGPFAIELSSRRVREASRLLDGVRQGQPLGALLGYRVERLLHETVVDNGRSMDRFIAPLRRVAPLVAALERDCRPGRSTPSPPNNVVDGLVLHRRWKEERSGGRRGGEQGGHGHQRPVGALVDPRHSWPTRSTA